MNCFFALSSSFTVSSSSACAFCSRSMPCRECQPGVGGTSCPHCPGAGDVSLPRYLLEHPLLRQAGSPGGLHSKGTVALRGGDTDLPSVRGPLYDTLPDSHRASVGVKTGQGTHLMTPGWLLGMPARHPAPPAHSESGTTSLGTSNPGLHLQDTQILVGIRHLPTGRATDGCSRTLILALVPFPSPP